MDMHVFSLALNDIITTFQETRDILKTDESSEDKCRRSRVASRPLHGNLMRPITGTVHSSLRPNLNIALDHCAIEIDCNQFIRMKSDGPNRETGLPMDVGPEM